MLYDIDMYIENSVHFHILKAVDFHRFKSFFFYYKHQKRKRKEKLHERDIEYWFNDKSNNNKKTLTQKKWRAKIENWTSRRQQQAKWNKYKFIYKILCENDSHEKFNEFCNLFMRLYF